MTHFTRLPLRLAAPMATIMGGPDFYVQKGSTINLTCTIRLGPEEAPAYIFWYHQDEVSEHLIRNSDCRRGKCMNNTLIAVKVLTEAINANKKTISSPPFPASPLEFREHFHYIYGVAFESSKYKHSCYLHCFGTEEATAKRIKCSRAVLGGAFDCRDEILRQFIRRARH